MRSAAAIQAVIEQRRKNDVERVMCYALRHAVDSFVGMGKDAPKKSPAGFACRFFTALKPKI